MFKEGDRVVISDEDSMFFKQHGIIKEITSRVEVLLDKNGIICSYPFCNITKESFKYTFLLKLEKNYI